MNAFLTGSRAYGTPHEKSDIDLVVLVSQPELEALLAIHYSASDPKEYEGATLASLRFGKLNLLCTTGEDDFAVWREGTDELIARKPVARSEAVALFTKKRATLEAARSTALAEHLAEIDAIASTYEETRDEF